MHVTEYQRVRLNYPEDLKLVNDFEKDDAWKCVGYGSSGSVWEKVISEYEPVTKYVKEAGEQDG